MLATKTLKTALTGSALMVIAGCASVPDTSRTGRIHDVRFEESMTPTIVRARVGDEVRWTNQRSRPVELDVIGEALRDVDCQRGFDDFTGTEQEEATILPEESVSLCFGTVGTVTYNARMDASVAGDQSIESGTVQIER